MDTLSNIADVVDYLFGIYPYNNSDHSVIGVPSEHVQSHIIDGESVSDPTFVESSVTSVSDPTSVSAVSSLRSIEPSPYFVSVRPSTSVKLPVLEQKSESIEKQQLQCCCCFKYPCKIQTNDMDHCTKCQIRLMLCFACPCMCYDKHPVLSIAMELLCCCCLCDNEPKSSKSSNSSGCDNCCDCGNCGICCSGGCDGCDGCGGCDGCTC